MFLENCVSKNYAVSGNLFLTIQNNKEVESIIAI